MSFGFPIFHDSGFHFVRWTLAPFWVMKAENFQNFGKFGWGFHGISILRFPKINGNFRILKWRYVNVPYFWPYFAGIFPYIGLKNGPYIW